MSVNVDKQQEVHDEVPEAPLSFTDYLQFFRTDQRFKTMEESFNWALKESEESRGW